MDEATERKVRDLRLRILKTERELAATQHSANLGAWLHAGHAGQIQRTAEKDRKRLETKLEELKAKLEEIAPGSSAPPQEKPKKRAVVSKAETEKAAAKSPKKTVAVKATTKKAAAKKPAAKKAVKKPAR